MTQVSKRPPISLMNSLWKHFILIFKMLQFYQQPCVQKIQVKTYSQNIVYTRSSTLCETFVPNHEQLTLFLISRLMHIPCLRCPQGSWPSLKTLINSVTFCFTDKKSTYPQNMACLITVINNLLKNLKKTYRFCYSSAFPLPPTEKPLPATINIELAPGFD